MGVSVTIGPDLVKRFDDLLDLMSDMTPFFKDLADLELSETHSRFNKQVDPDFKPWALPTAARRRTGRANPRTRPFSKSLGDKILRDTGTMYNSIGRAYGKDFAEVGTNISYAVYHQSDEPRTVIPQRKMFGVNKVTLETIDKLIKAYLELKL